jgi:hypothetical protein
VADYLGRIAAAGLSWPLPDDVDDADLERRLFTRSDFPPQSQRPMPDWAAVHRELRRPSVTLQLLWMEHKEAHPDGHQYTQFVHHYREWARHLDLVLRQEHRAGEKLFLDFAGETIPVVDPETGVGAPWELFVGVLGASDYTYAEALPSQELPQWIAAHVRCFAFMGGCPRILVPDYVPRHIIGPDHRGYTLELLERVLVSAQEVIALLPPHRLLVPVPGARERHPEDPGAAPLARGRVEDGRRALEVVDLSLFARQMLHDVGHLRPPPPLLAHEPLHRFVPVGEAVLGAELLPDPLRGEPSAEHLRDLRAERLAGARRPRRRAGGRVWPLLPAEIPLSDEVGRRAGGRVGRI